MIIFLLRDSTPEPNCEEYDYVVTLNYDEKKILEEIDNYIRTIKEYDFPVTVYLRNFLVDKNIEFTIKSFRNMDTIYY